MWAYIGIIVQLILLEGILSLDNAAVLGAMVAPLPDDRPIPWPRPLRPLGRFLDPILGPQRDAALKVGLLGAYLGRGLMLFIAAWVIRNPWLRLVGAAYLIYLAAMHLGDGEEGDGGEVRRGDGSFWYVVLHVELADLAFSLDNVVVAVALSDKFWVVMTGVALGILTMRFAAAYFARLVRWEPALAPAAYVLIFNLGIVLIAEDFGWIHLNEAQRFGISAGTLLLAVLWARVKIVRWALTPFLWVGRRLMQLLRTLFLVVLQPIRSFRKGHRALRDLGR